MSYAHSLAALTSSSRTRRFRCIRPIASIKFALYRSISEKTGFSSSSKNSGTTTPRNTIGASGKDHGFKARFFTPSDIRKKEEMVLTRMNRNEVSLANIAKTLSRFFGHTFVTWNSGNFYSLVSSNSAKISTSFYRSCARPQYQKNMSILTFLIGFIRIRSSKHKVLGFREP